MKPENAPATKRSAPDPKDKAGRRAALSSFLGSVIEYYDFNLYGTAAALVFGKVFFPAGNATVGTILALMGFGISFVVRPFGAIVFGHFGDRFGRKRVLQVTIILMGGSSFLIGVLPTYETIGIAAPIMLAVCRLGQGLSAGAEQVGASLLTMEHSSDKKRALYASWTPAGSTIGTGLASTAFLPLLALPEEVFLGWAWRIPFLLSVITVAITLYMRSRVEESPEYARAQESGNAAPTRFKAPLLTVLRSQPGALLCVFTCTLFATTSAFVTVFGISYARRAGGGIDQSTMLTAIGITQVVALFTIPLFAALSRHVSLKVMFAGGSLLCGLGAVFYLIAIDSGSTLAVVAAALLLKGVFYSIPYSIWPVFYGRQFESGVRFTGVAVAQQTSYIMVGFTPAICVALLGADNDSFPVMVYIVGLCALASVAALFSRDVSKARSANSSQPQTVETPVS